jgi:hypothetical protein
MQRLSNGQAPQCSAVPELSMAEPGTATAMHGLARLGKGGAARSTAVIRREEMSNAKARNGDF